MAEYIVIENNIIKGIYCGSVLEDENTIILPINHQVQEGDRLDFYNEDFSRKSDYELIIQGLIDIPKGYKIINETLVEMDYHEKIIAGLIPLPKFYKIDNNKVIEMEEQEKLSIMEHNEKIEYHKNKRNNLLNQVLWQIERHNQEKILNIATSLQEEEYINLLKYIQKLRDITKQKTFPENVVYPIL